MNTLTNRSCRAFLLACLISLSLVSTVEVSKAGWNPLKDIGNAVGSVARGIGGIFGQGLAGFAGPTVTETANTFQRVANETLLRVEGTGGRLIDKLVKDANVAAEARIVQVSAVLTAQIEDVDVRIREHIAKVDEVITTKLGSADIIATRQINNFEIAAMNVVRYASLVMLISVALAILFYVAASRWRPDMNVAKLGPGLVYGVALLGLFSGIAALSTSILRPPSDEKLNLIGSQLVKSYGDSVHSGDLDSAVYFASQYSSLDATALAPRFLVQFADLQRDLLRRSALFTSESGTRELVARVSQIARTWETVSSEGNLPEAIAFLKYEVPATASMIAWQNASTVDAQQKAGCMAAGALAEYKLQVTDQQRQIEQASGYVWLAASYVNWLTKTDPSWNINRIATACSRSVEQEIGPDGWIQTASEVAKNFIGRPSDAPPSIAPVFMYNVESAAFYRDVVVQYSNAAVGDTQYRAYETVEQIQASKAIRDSAAEAIVATWRKYAEKISKIPDLAGRDILLSSSGLPLGMVARAALIKTTERPAVDPANPTVVPPAPDRVALLDLAACTSLYADIKVLFAETVFETLCVNQQAVDEKMRAFEADLQTAFASKTQIRQQLLVLRDKYISEGTDLLSLTTNLSSCIVGDNTLSVWKPCTEQSNQIPVRLLDWLAHPDSVGDEVALPMAATRVAMVR
ncbi:hypothetical protein [Mesorhizobium cantuariense]|uniref:Uncharacterized protein n=1 Tax=Mesorhizobium cantuariense TaxID=1300275 RepID=A0ABV7MZG4_9HYPH